MIAPLPAHEPVQAAELGDPLRARATRNRWNVLPSTSSKPSPRDVGGGQRAHAAPRRERDEGRGLDRAVRECGAARSGRLRHAR